MDFTTKNTNRQVIFQLAVSCESKLAACSGVENALRWYKNRELGNTNNTNNSMP